MGSGGNLTPKFKGIYRRYSLWTHWAHLAIEGQFFYDPPRFSIGSRSSFRQVVFVGKSAASAVDEYSTMDCCSTDFRVRFATILALVCSCAGCLLAPSQRVTDASAEGNYFPEKAGSKEQAPTPAAGKPASPTPGDLSTAMAEVHQLGKTDPSAQQALVDDLHRTDPSLWPQLIRAYQTSLAYRQQSAERTARLAQQNAPNGNLNGMANMTMAPTSAPTGAVSGTLPQNQLVQNNSYPGTAISSEQQASAPAVFSLQHDQPKTLPTSVEGAILPTSPAADFGDNYPSTELPEVRLVGAEAASPVSNSPDDNWQSQLAAATRTLESQISAGANASPSATDQAMLRMLYLAAGRRDDALRPLIGVSAVEQEFWTKELAGLEKLFDGEQDGDISQRTAEATRQLQQAATKLAQSTPLVVHNLAFCTEVSSFGVYKPMVTQRFKPGQQLLLYAEVENFVSEPTEKGYRTLLNSRYEILNRAGNRITNEDFGLIEEHCRNLRHDFFVRYFLKLPQSLPAGQYTLKLTMEDTAAVKTANGQIQFEIVE